MSTKSFRESISLVDEIRNLRMHFIYGHKLAFLSTGNIVGVIISLYR